MKPISTFHRREFLSRALLLGAAGTLAPSLPAWAFSPTQVAPAQKKEVMLQELTIADFSPYVGTRFKLRLATGGSLEVELVEATPLGMTGARPAHLAPRGSFSVVFLAAKDAPLPQQIYHVEHEVMGEFDIFLVPIGRTATGLKCEAIFN